MYKNMQPITNVVAGFYSAFNIHFVLIDKIVENNNPSVTK